MSEYAKLKEDIESLVLDRLGRYGFVRKRPVYVKPLEDEVFGWVGLNTADYPALSECSVNPVVGVHNKKLERLIGQLRERDHSKRWFATVAKPIGYLMPVGQFTTFSFAVGGDTEKGVQDVVSNIVSFGTPWMTQLVDLESLQKAVERESVREDASYRLPGIHLLQGNKNKALQVAGEYRKVWQGKGEHETAYEKFIERVANWEG